MHEIHDHITEEDIEVTLVDFFGNYLDDETIEILLGTVQSCDTFSNAGVLTYNKGLVLRMKSGQEFQITIVQSR